MRFATKANLKNAAGVDTSYFPKETDKANLKYDIDKLDINKLKNMPSNSSNLKSRVSKLDVEKLETTPVYLSKLSDIV